MEVLSREAALRKLERMAYEITEDNFYEKEIVLAGIKSNGLIIAQIIKRFLTPIFDGEVKIIEIEINKRQPKEVALNYDSSSIQIENNNVIITDDVANSGKTLSYALRPFLNYYPAKIQTLVLVERSHKKFPVTPDYTGLSIATALSEKIVVETKDGDVVGASIQEN